MPKAPHNNHLYVTFWGTRGSVSTPGSTTEKYGGNTPCVSVRHQQTQIILDAGTGIRNLGLELARQNGRLDLHLLLSHTHWDHIQGLPFFSPAYQKRTRLTIYGSPRKEHFLEAILQRQMDVNYFPVDMTAFAADMSIIEFARERIKIGSVQVDWQEQVCHPGGSVRYRISSGGRRIVYATDIELNTMFKSKVRQNALLARQYQDFIRNADLLIADAQYTDDEYPSCVHWGHSSMSVLFEAAARAGVKQLAMFHHDPQHTDIALDTLQALYAQRVRRRGYPMNVFYAREGMTLAI